MRIWRQILASTAALATVACGFHPLYGTSAGGTNVASELAGVYVEPISERTGYELRNSLLDLLNSGPPGSSLYSLKLNLREREDAVILQTNTSITRYNYTLTAHYDLLPRGTATAVKSGDLTSFAAYNVAAAPFLYATATAKSDAHMRAANDIAERLRIELAVYLHEAAEKSASASPR
jgi:LPS-assembly lipoprotein